MLRNVYMRIRPYWMLIWLGDQWLNHCHFLATQKAKRAGLTASNLKIVRFAFQILSQISQIYWRKREEIFQYLKMNTVFWKVSVELFNYFEFGTQIWINNLLYSRIKNIHLFFKHTLLRFFIMKTLKTWFSPFLFTDCLLKREIVCKLCGGNESS